MKKNKKIK